MHKYVFLVHFLCVKNKVSEVFVFGFDIEIVVSDAIPLTVKQTDESHDEAETHTDSETRKANYVKSVKFLFQWLWKNIWIDMKQWKKRWQ